MALMPEVRFPPHLRHQFPLREKAVDDCLRPAEIRMRRVFRLCRMGYNDFAGRAAVVNCVRKKVRARAEVGAIVPFDTSGPGAWPGTLLTLGKL